MKLGGAGRTENYATTLVWGCQVGEVAAGYGTVRCFTTAGIRSNRVPVTPGPL